MKVKWKSLRPVWPFVTPWMYSPWDSPGQNTGVGSLSLLQGIFPTQGSNPGLPHCRRILYQLSHKESPYNNMEESQRNNAISKKLSIPPHRPWPIPICSKATLNNIMLISPLPPSYKHSCSPNLSLLGHHVASFHRHLKSDSALSLSWVSFMALCSPR